VSTGDRDTELPPPSVNFLLKKGGGKSVPLAPVDVRDNYSFVDIDGIADQRKKSRSWLWTGTHVWRA
jgi:hypothetical protein